MERFMIFFRLFVGAICLFTVLARGQARAEPTITPEKMKAAVAELEKLTEQTLKKTGVPGIAVAIVFRDEVVYLKGFGVREAGREESIDADTVFQLASVSKPITSSILAVLVGEKRLGWDDRVIDHDPDFRMFDPWVTRELQIRDLLSHRSGLPDHAGDLLEDLGYEQAEILKRLRYVKPASSFRAGYAYTNFGFTEAAVAGARAVGKTWDDLAAEKLFRPLGMQSTTTRHADFVKARNRAKLHVPIDGKWVARYDRQPDAQSPAGGVNSTARDLTRWMRLQLADGKFEGKQIIASAALAETHHPLAVSAADVKAGRIASYALGWGVTDERGGRIFWKHSGAFSLGVRTQVALLPAEQLGIAVLSNAFPTGIPEGLTESFFDLVLDGKVQRDWITFANRMFDEEMKRELGKETDYSKPPAQKSPALPLAAYAGTYHNRYFGNIDIVEEKNTLVLRLGPKKMTFPLRHWDRDIFLYQPSGEMSGGPSRLIFRIGPDRSADTVLIENLNSYGQGTFKRVVPAPKPAK
jgi:CubicO group peptidase (beta-lactamase class C family)